MATKCPLGCMLPGSCLCDLVRSDVSLLPLDHSWTRENYSACSRPQNSRRKPDALQGSSPLQNRLLSAVTSSPLSCILGSTPGWVVGPPCGQISKPSLGFFLSLGFTSGLYMQVMPVGGLALPKTSSPHLLSRL